MNYKLVVPQVFYDILKAAGYNMEMFVVNKKLPLIARKHG